MEVGFPNGTATNMYYFNQDLFVESGLETPLELYQRDAWTWDAFRKAARRNMRYDSSGNPITWGASVHLGDTLSHGWIWSNGGLEVDDVKNPTVALWDRPEAVEALDFMQRMIHDDEVAIREGSTTNGFLNGTLAMYARWNSAFPLHAQAPFEWGIVPYPKGPSAQGRYAATSPRLWPRCHRPSTLKKHGNGLHSLAVMRGMSSASKQAAAYQSGAALPSGRSRCINPTT